MLSCHSAFQTLSRADRNVKFLTHTEIRLDSRQVFDLNKVFMTALRHPASDIQTPVKAFTLWLCRVRASRLTMALP